MHDVNEAMEKLLQHYRHDFLNVLQVVGGLAQLQKTDKLLAYIREASEETQQFARFVGCGDARLALAVFDALLQNMDGDYVLQVEGSIPSLEPSFLDGLACTLAVASNCMQKLQGVTLAVDIEGGTHPTLNLRLLGEKESIWQPVLLAANQNGLRASIDAKNCEFSLLLDKWESAGEK
ncbi:MAG: Spo0B domain-containing protein [Firmicutes bacterium]|nr:Spo0B domain-containing protein [Bacillota bacterium]